MMSTLALGARGGRLTTNPHLTTLFYFFAVVISLIVITRPAHAVGSVAYDYSSAILRDGQAYTHPDITSIVNKFKVNYGVTMTGCTLAGAVWSCFNNKTQIRQDVGWFYNLTCPANSVLSGSCTCNTGYQPDPTATSCVSNACPANMSGSPCACNTGFVPSPYYGAGCVAVTTCPANSSGSPCVCNTDFVRDSAGNCVQEQYTLSLQVAPPAQVEPSKSANVTAKVVNTLTGQPKAGALVNIKVDVDPGTGGHDHDTGRHVSPYTGVLSAATGTTVADGTASFTFTAPGASGTHTFTVQCVSLTCSNNPVTTKIDVKVDGLAPIPASPFYVFVGATDKHINNHYLTKEAASVLKGIAAAYQVEQQFKLGGVTPPPLFLNDASLIWGGKFDVAGQWVGDHAEHMRGTVIDMRANSLTGAISLKNFKAFRKLAVFYRADAKIHSPGESNQHFHVRLLNRGE